MGMFMKFDRSKGGPVWINPLSIDTFRKDPYLDESDYFEQGTGSLIETRSGSQIQVKQKPEEVETMIETWVSEAVYDLPGDDEEPYTGAMPEDQG